MVVVVDAPSILGARVTAHELRGVISTDRADAGEGSREAAVVPRHLWRFRASGLVTNKPVPAIWTGVNDAAVNRAPDGRSRVTTAHAIAAQAVEYIGRCDTERVYGDVSCSLSGRFDHQRKQFAVAPVQGRQSAESDEIGGKLDQLGDDEVHLIWRSSLGNGHAGVRCRHGLLHEPLRVEEGGVDTYARVCV